ncbi:hypothetical protein BDZ91DRAFT_635187, partial [Kalaharituber pfeilii]
KALGADHPEALDTVTNMAIVFKHQGQCNKALEWCKRALAGKERAPGAYHPVHTTRTLETVYSTAPVFHEQEQYNKALEWYERALAGREKTLG